MWRIPGCRRRALRATIQQLHFVFNFPAKTRCHPDANSSIPDFNSPLLAVSPASLGFHSLRREIRSHWRGARATPRRFFRHRTTVSRRRLELSFRRIAFSRQRTDVIRRRIALSPPLPALRVRQRVELPSTPGRNPHFNTERRDERESGERCPPWCRLISVLGAQRLLDRSRKTAEKRLTTVQSQRRTSQSPRRRATSRQRTEVNATSVAETQQRNELSELTTELRDQRNELSRQTTELRVLRPPRQC